MRCPKCNKENARDAVFCSRCGAELKKKNKNKVVIAILSCTLLIAVICAVVFFRDDLVVKKETEKKMIDTVATLLLHENQAELGYDYAFSNNDEEELIIEQVDDSFSVTKQWVVEGASTYCDSKVIENEDYLFVSIDGENEDEEYYASLLAISKEGEGQEELRYLSIEDGNGIFLCNYEDDRLYYIIRCDTEEDGYEYQLWAYDFNKEENIPISLEYIHSFPIFYQNKIFYVNQDYDFCYINKKDNGDDSAKVLCRVSEGNSIRPGYSLEKYAYALSDTAPILTQINLKNGKQIEYQLETRFSEDDPYIHLLSINEDAVFYTDDYGVLWKLDLKEDECIRIRIPEVLEDENCYIDAYTGYIDKNGRACSFLYDEDGNVRNLLITEPGGDVFMVVEELEEDIYSKILSYNDLESLQLQNCFFDKDDNLVIYCVDWDTGEKDLYKIPLT